MEYVPIDQNELSILHFQIIDVNNNEINFIDNSNVLINIIIKKINQ